MRFYIIKKHLINFGLWQQHGEAGIDFTNLKATEKAGKEDLCDP